MDLSKLAGTLLSSDSISGLSEATGASGSDVSKVLATALPVLLSGASDQAKDKKTSNGFASALSDHAKDDTSNLSAFLGNVDLEDGAKIIGHLLGSGKDDTVDEVAKDTGVSSNNTAAILSAAAPLLLSLLGQQTEKEDKKEAIGDLVGVLLENVDVGSLLTGLLTDKSSKDEKKSSTKKSSSSKSTTKKTSSKSGSTKKSSSKSGTKKSTSSTKKKASTAKTSTKKSSGNSTKKTSTKKASTKKKSASDNSTGELIGGILKSLLK